MKMHTITDEFVLRTKDGRYLSNLGMDETKLENAVLHDAPMVHGCHPSWEVIPVKVTRIFKVELKNPSTQHGDE